MTDSLFSFLRVWLAKRILPRGHYVYRDVKPGEFVDYDVRGDDALGI